MAYRIETFVASDRLPSLPQVALRVIELAWQPEPNIAELSEVIRSDAALAGKILKTVNSALFGMRGKVSSIEFATAKLGVSLLRTLVLSFSLTEEATNGRGPGSTLRRFWQASLSQAVFAELLAERKANEDPADYFLGGLLQSIGILAFLSVEPERYESRVVEISRFPRVATAERQHFGFTHVDVGQRMCTRWGLPPDFVDAMSHHQDYVESGSFESEDHLIVSLQAANLFACYLGESQDANRRHLEPLFRLLHERYAMKPIETQELVEEACDRIGEMAAIFSFDAARLVPAQRILENAKQLLVEMALESQWGVAASCAAGSAVGSRSDPNFLL